VKHDTLTKGGMQELTYIDEVLPEIRCTGSYENISFEEVIVKTVTLAVSETVKVLVPLMKSPAPAVNGKSENSEPKRIRKQYRYNNAEQDFNA